MKFSIIVPIFNIEHYLKECISSILNQTFTEFELILVNDGSTDGSAQICYDFASIDKRVVVVNKQNGGLSSARNSGLKLCTGSHVIFIDGDDILLNIDALQNIANLIEKYGNEIVVFWKYRRFSVKYKRSNKKISKGKVIYTDKDKVKCISKGLIYASSWYVSVPLAFFDSSLLFKEGEKSEDVEWFYALLSKNPTFVLCDDKLYGYRIRNNSLSNTLTIDTMLHMQKHILNMLDQFNSIKENPTLYSYFLEQVSNYFIVFSRTNANYDTYKNVNEQILCFYKAPKRYRSKILYFLIKVFGFKKTIGILRRIR